MSAMTAVAVTLARPHSNSQAAQLRLALVDGPKTCRQLHDATGVPAARVRGILKVDIDLGRIRCVLRGPGIGVYSLAEQLDLQQRLREARALLVRHGYAVSRSREQA